MRLQSIDGRYQILRSLGSTAMGEVYRVKDLSTGSILALKLSPAQSAQEDLIRLRREFYTLSRLRHPNIVEVKDFGILQRGEPAGRSQAGPRCYFSMEYVEGEDILRWFGKKHPLTHMTCQHLYSAVLQLCQVLSYIHSNGLVHCDLKPANVLIAKHATKVSGQSADNGKSLMLKLLDFGSASDVTLSSSATGTLGYMAPEVLKSGRADPRSDLYSLGVIMWEILTRRRAFPGDNPASIIRDNLSKLLPAPTRYEPAIPRQLEHVVLRLVSKEPRERYPSALEVLKELSSTAPQISVEKLPSERSYLLSSSLVGRDGVLSNFKSLLDEAKKDRGYVMVLRGERGIGKSRLLQEFKFQAQLDGSSVLFGSCCQSERVPFSPWRQILLQLSQKDGQKVPQFTQEVQSPQDRLAPAKLQTLERIASRILGSSKENTNPLVILIDDLDLADSNSVELFVYLSRSLAKSRVVLAAFCEENSILADYLKQLAELTVTTTIELTELSLQETHLMIANMLGSGDSHDALGQWVYELAGGNPLLIEETMSSLVKDRILKREGLNWRFGSEELRTARPSRDIESLVDSWFNRLDKREAASLSLASVLGDRFDVRILEELSNLETPAFFEALDNMEGQNLVRREHGTDFVFTHKWARRILYDRIPSGKRRNLHAKAARAIEQFSPSRWFDLAHHCLNGGIKGKAYKYVLLAGEKARESLANKEALEYYDSALRLSHELNKPQHRPRIFEKVGDVCDLLGKYREGLEAYHLAHTTLASRARPHPLALATLLRKISTIHHKRGDYSKAMESLQEAKVVASKHRRSEEMARILNEIGWVHQLRGEYDEASGSYHQALEIAKDRADLAMLSRTHYNLGVLLWNQRNLAGAIKRCRKALSIDRQTKDLHALASSYDLLGAIYLASGDHDKAVKSHQESLKLRTKAGEVYGQCISSISLGILARRQGRLNEAEDHLSESLSQAEKIGEPKMHGRVHNNLGLVRQQKGDWDKAMHHYSRSLREYRKSGDELLMARCHSNLGTLHLQMGNLRKADDNIRKSLKSRQKLSDSPGLASSYCDLGQLLMAQGQWREASRSLLKSKDIYEQEEDKFDLPQVDGLLAEVYLSLGDRETALRYCQSTIELSKKMRNLYAQGSAHRTMAKVYSETGDGDKVEDNLSKSIGIFRRLGTRFELGKSLLESGGLALTMGEEKQTGDWFLSVLASLREAERIFRALKASSCLETSRSLLGVLIDRVLSGDFDFCRREDYFNILHQISELVNSISSQDELVGQVLDLVIDLVGGERGLLLLIDDKTHDLFLATGRNIDKATISDATRISRTIVDEVVESGKPVVSNDALHDPLFKESNSVVVNNIRSLLCVPLMTKGEIVGTIYVDSRAQANLFSQTDEEFLVWVANLIGSAVDQSKFCAGLQSENLSLKRKLRRRRGLKDMIGKSEEMERIYEAVEKVAATDCSVLLQGETGTGKELLARAIHDLGGRSTSKFLAIDCSALVEPLLQSELFGHKRGSFTGAVQDKVGLLEEADRGTAFLDEIGDASISVQAKLLRAIERGEIRRVGETKWRKVDVRVICATNKDLEEEVRTGRFRKDLFYRLTTFTLKVPPLRDRTGDVYLLASHFLKRYRTQFKKEISGFTPDALEYLVNHPWPGNVRQLEKSVQRAVIMCDERRITLNDISPESVEAMSSAVSLKEIKAQTEAERVNRALIAAKGSVTKAAEKLGVARKQLYRLMERYNIDRNALKR